MLEKILYKIEHGIDIGYIEYDWFVSYITALEDANKELKFENEHLKLNIKQVKKYLEGNEKEYGSLEDNEKIILEILNGSDK